MHSDVLKNGAVDKKAITRCRLMDGAVGKSQVSEATQTMFSAAYTTSCSSFGDVDL